MVFSNGHCRFKFGKSKLCCLVGHEFDFIPVGGEGTAPQPPPPPAMGLVCWLDVLPGLNIWKTFKISLVEILVYCKLLARCISRDSL